MTKLEKIMGDLGHPEHLRGTDLLRRGVDMYRPGMRMTKELYPALAKATGTNPSAVERSMRHSISVAWARGDTEAQQRFFGYRVDPLRGMPTVGEYVATMARLVRQAEGQE